MTVGLAVPVLNNFKGFAELIYSADFEFRPYIIPNWVDNVGVGPGWNSALREAAEDWIDELIIVNDDVQFRPGAVNNLLHWSRRGYDLVSPQNETGVCHPGGLNFWCFVVRPAEFLHKFGTFDENFAPAYYEDDDMARRIRLLGGTIKTTNDFIHHAVMGTETDPAEHVWWYQKNIKYYAEKWGGEPTRETFDHPYNDSSKSATYWRKNAG